MARECWIRLCFLKEVGMPVEPTLSLKAYVSGSSSSSMIVLRILSIRDRD